MKKLLLVIFIASVTIVNAQIKNNEIGLNFINVLNSNLIEYSDYNANSKIRLIPGLVFKKHFKAISLRSSLKLFSGEYTSFEGDKDMFYSYDSAKYTLTNIKLGVEKNFKINKIIKLAAGIDFIFDKNNRKGYFESYNDWTPYGTSDNYHIIENYIAIAPIVGLTTSISKRLMFTLESNFSFRYQLGRNQKINRYSVLSDFNPLSTISLSYKL